MDLDRRHLQHLESVARCRSVTRAARELGLTQPALSRSIREIERLLGLRLFDRLPQGAVPTSACAALLERAQGLLSGFEALEHEAQRLGERYSGPLAIGLGPGVASGSAILEVGRLVAFHPDLRVRVVIAPAVELARQLRGLEIELFVGDQTPVEGSEEPLVLEPLEYEAILLCRAGHPILRSSAPLAEVSRYPIALVGPPPAALASLRELLREGDPALPAEWMPPLLVDQASALERLLPESDAIGGSAAYIHAGALRRGVLRAIPLPRPVYRGRVGPVRLRDRMLSPAGEALWKAMTDALQRDLSPASDVD